MSTATTIPVDYDDSLERAKLCADSVDDLVDAYSLDEVLSAVVVSIEETEYDSEAARAVHLRLAEEQRRLASIAAMLHAAHACALSWSDAEHIARNVAAGEPHSRREARARALQSVMRRTHPGSVHVGAEHVDVDVTAVAVADAVAHAWEQCR